MLQSLKNGISAQQKKEGRKEGMIPSQRIPADRVVRPPDGLGWRELERVLKAADHRDGKRRRRLAKQSKWRLHPSAKGGREGGRNL